MKHLCADRHLSYKVLREEKDVFQYAAPPDVDQVGGDMKRRKVRRWERDCFGH
jgi:hypothetical protein